MKLSKPIFLLASMVVAGSVLVGCSGEKEEVNQVQEPPQQNETPSVNEKDTENSDPFVIEESAVGKQVSAYQELVTELGNAKEGKAVDWEKVSTLYENELQNAITEINGDFDQAISAAITAGANQEIAANIVRQLIDKTTQSYFYQKQKSLHNDVVAQMELENQQEAKQIFAELKHLVNEVIIPTAKKRDSYFELTGEDSMVESLENGLAVQEQALNEGNVADYAVYKQITDKTAYRSHYLAALSYAEKIEKAVEDGNIDKVDLQIKQAEAWGFYQAIKGSLSSGNEEAANELNTLFSLNSTDPTTIKRDQVANLFVKAFVGKILSYHEKVPNDLNEGNLTDARSHALEGNVFMKGIELEMIEKLGEEKAANAFENGELWYKAVENENEDDIAKYSENVVTILKGLVQE